MSGELELAEDISKIVFRSYDFGKKQANNEFLRFLVDVYPCIQRHRDCCNDCGDSRQKVKQKIEQLTELIK